MTKIIYAYEESERYENIVMVKYDDGITEKLFGYYPDELMFNVNAFMGLTKQEALNLYHDKDIAYLRS